MSRAFWAEEPDHTKGLKKVFLGGPRVSGQPWRLGQGWSVCLERTELLGDEALKPSWTDTWKGGLAVQTQSCGHWGASEGCRAKEMVG